MPVLTDIAVLYQCRADGPQGDAHPVPDAALVYEGETLRWVGPRVELPDRWAALPAESAGGGIVVPGLVDCHTHLAFGGWRAAEFEQRILGRSYLEIARAGGGIRSTVAATRAASRADLVARCRAHLDAMATLGVTTVEAKSGYGLTRDDEIRLLEIYREVGRGRPQRVVPTLLAAHTVPPEYEGRREEYVQLVIEAIIPAAARDGLARFCDVFVEETAFSIAEARRIFAAARAHGLVPKLHADQLSAGGGAELAAEVGAASADHLEHASDAGIHSMAAAGVVAVSLPLASLYLGQPPFRARRFLAAGVAVAVATDFNPGSAPSYHLPFALTLACLTQRMTPAEALKGATIVAARAIGLEREVGSLEAGKSANFAVLAAPTVEHWLYQLQSNVCCRAVARGVEVWHAPVS